MDLRKKYQVVTLVFPIARGNILLGKKTAKVGKDLYNGFGGSQEKGETIRECASRELWKEAGVSARTDELVYLAKITINRRKIVFKNGVHTYERKIFECHIFTYPKWNGKSNPNREVKDLKVFDANQLPFHEMISTDIDWMCFVVNRQRFVANVFYDVDKSLSYERTVVNFVKLDDVD